MSTNVALQAELLLRLVLSVICGGAIGYERKNRGKGAGIRTHVIVTVASCLMMITSQYGFEKFFDFVASANVDIRLDPSRIASQIVSGVGFLGAGMIFVHKGTVTGLTTAAGVWATAGIGMALGSGMYFIGGSATVIIVVLQVILHKNLSFLYMPAEREMTFVIKNVDDALTQLFDLLGRFDMTPSGFKSTRTEDDLIKFVVTVTPPPELDAQNLLRLAYENENIKSVNF